MARERRGERRERAGELGKKERINRAFVSFSQPLNNLNLCSHLSTNQPTKTNRTRRGLALHPQAPARRALHPAPRRRHGPRHRRAEGDGTPRVRGDFRRKGACGLCDRLPVLRRFRRGAAEPREPQEARRGHRRLGGVCQGERGKKKGKKAFFNLFSFVAKRRKSGKKRTQIFSKKTLFKNSPPSPPESTRTGSPYGAPRWPGATPSSPARPWATGSPPSSPRSLTCRAGLPRRRTSKKEGFCPSCAWEQQPCSTPCAASAAFPRST